MKLYTEKIREFLQDSTKRSVPAVLLFSGGLDSSILSAIVPDITTVSVNYNKVGEDSYFSEIVNDYLNLKNHMKIVDTDEAIETIPEIIKILKSFDPAIPNDVTAYIGIKYIKSLGFDNVMTGDGSDEIFAGYSFMQEMDDLDQYLKRMTEQMTFSSNKICAHFNLRIIQPYLDERLVKFVSDIPIDLKIKKQNGFVHGKWILRKSFEGILPDNIIWQSKRPLEIGSGMTRIRDILCSLVSDNEFSEAQKSFQIKFISKEHYYYYKIYRKVIGDIPKPVSGEKICPGCGTGLKPAAFHCDICGYVLNWR